MVRLKFLRILVPALLVPFLLLIVLMLRQRPAALSRAPGEAKASGARAEGIEMTELWTGSRRLYIRARLGEMDLEGRVHLDGVERVEVDRERRSPLVVRADRGGVDGKPGHRTMNLEGGVVVRDEGAGLSLSLPGLEVDEAASLARSLGAVHFEGPGYEGTAATITYGLNERQPTTLAQPRVSGKDGSRLSADAASVREDRLHMELVGEVDVLQGSLRLRSERAEVTRDEEGRLKSAVATGEVRCSGLVVSGMASELAAGSLHVEWDSEGQPAHLVAEGSPVARRGEQALRAERFDITRPASGRGGWDFVAKGDVRASGLFESAPATLFSEELTAEIDSQGTLLRADALRNARFEGNEARGQAASARFVPGGKEGELTLLAGPGEPARIARGRTRVAAQRIVTDARGSHLSADERVEATLLGAPKDPRAKHAALFEAGEALHFVSDHLEADVLARRYRFRGTVRGWQGERNLSAEEVEIDQERDTIHARTKVASRFPREAGSAKAENDYVQIFADALDYTGSTRKAVYDGAARILVSEGWLEGSRIEVDLDEAGNGIRELRAQGGVHLELRSSTRGQVGGPIKGKGDRVIYRPKEQLVRLIGDEAPASVTRSGTQGGTTMGRVLRYRLDAGTLEVESEDQERVAPGRGAGT